jgi:hypothetical protein
MIERVGEDKENKSAEISATRNISRSTLFRGRRAKINKQQRTQKKTKEEAGTRLKKRSR